MGKKFTFILDETEMPILDRALSNGLAIGNGGFELVMNIRTQFEKQGGYKGTSIETVPATNNTAETPNRAARRAKVKRG